MIGVPFDNNGLNCVSATSEVTVDLVERRDPLLLELSEQFPTTQALAAWIRTLPQRDDEGLPDDGPKVEACEPDGCMPVDPLEWMQRWSALPWFADTSCVARRGTERGGCDASPP